MRARRGPPTDRSVERARRLTLYGLVKGRVYTATASSGETLTIGRHCLAVNETDSPRWEIAGYDPQPRRRETFHGASAAVARWFELTSA